MIDSIDLIGQWYLPQNPASKFAGRLTFDQEKDSELLISGSFLNVLLGSTIIDVILGETDGGEVTLLDSFTLKRSQTQSKFKPRFIIKGSHYKVRNNIPLSNVSFTLHNLDPFISRKGFNFKHNTSVKWSLIKKVNRTIPFSIQDVAKGKFTTGCEINFTNTTKVNLASWHLVTLDFKTQTQLDEAITLIGIFKGFIHLINNDTTFPTYISFKEGNKTVYISYKHSFFNAKEKERIHSFITYDELKPNFSKYISNWFSKYRSYDHIFNLRLAHFSKRNNFSSERFIDATRVLESFHRLNRNNKIISPSKYKSEVEKVFSIKYTPIFNDFLKSKLSHGIEYSFSQKLNQLINELPNSLKLILKKNKSFSYHVTTLRNYYTHYVLPERYEKPSLDQLIKLTDNLEALISFILLKEIGIDINLLENKYLNHNMMS